MNSTAPFGGEPESLSGRYENLLPALNLSRYERGYAVPEQPPADVGAEFLFQRIFVTLGVGYD